MTGNSDQGANSLIEWGYTGSGAPENWASLSPDFTTCANGRQQSPIDITGHDPGPAGALESSYLPSPATVRADGKFVHLDFSPGNILEVDDRVYELTTAHFHVPSEHLVDGRSFAAELQLVHADDDGNLAVVGQLFETGAAQLPGADDARRRSPARRRICRRCGGPS